MKVVYIEWLDARGIGGRMARKAAEEMGLLLLRTAGLLVGEDEKVVRVAQDYWKYEDEDGTAPETYRELEIIPKNGIKKREEWEPKGSKEGTG